VDTFVPTAKSVGRPLVNDEIVEYLCQQKSLKKLSLQAGIQLSICQKVVKKDLSMYPYKNKIPIVVILQTFRIVQLFSK
jgi:hypothetical protein